MTEIIKYSDLLMPPPFSTVLAVFLALGFKFISEISLHNIFKTELKPGMRSLWYFFTLGIISAFVFIAGSFLGINLQLLKWFSWVIAFTGILELIRILKTENSFKKLYLFYKRQSHFYKYCLVIGFLILSALFLNVLAPPTDADSLGYHLGAAFNFIREGALKPRYDWFHYRLSGLGEILNMIGLSAGTDNFGAVLQFSGLLAILCSLCSYIKKDENRILFFLLIVSSPVLMFLVPNQKPQLLHGAAILIASVYITGKKGALKRNEFILVTAAVLFGMAGKYSFYIPGVIIFIVLFYFSVIRDRKYSYLLSFFAVYVIFLLPVHIHNFIFYGDPVSPILASYLGENTAPLVRFSEMLKNFRDSDFIFPLNLIFPDSPGGITTVLGGGIIIILFALKEQFSKNKYLISFILLIAVLFFFNGARCSRYYFELYVILCFAVSGVTYSKSRKFLESFLLLQASGMLLITFFGVYSSFPGSLTKDLRHKVMERQADYFTVLEWADDKLSDSDVVITTFRSGYLSPVSFFNADIINYTNFDSDYEKKAVTDLINEKNVNSLITNYPVSDNLLKNLDKEVELIHGPEEFFHGVRNPFNKGKSFKIGIYRIIN